MPGERKHDKAAILAKLAEMRAAGEISADELRAARERILGPGAAKVETPLQASQKPVAKRTGCGPILVGLIVLVVTFGIIGSRMGAGPADTAKSQGTGTAAPVTAADAENRRKGFHCLSAWDGSDDALVNAVKGEMREPSSFEHVETRITPVDAKGQHTVMMTFRGRNGFGGMNVETAIGVLSNATCDLISFKVLGES